MRNVLITGAGNGLGYELTRMHREAGFRVFALEREPSRKLGALAHEFPEAVRVYECDVGNTASVNKALCDIKQKIKRLERIFNNAGIHRFADWVTIEETDLDFCKTMFDINAVGPLRIVKAAIGLLGQDSLIVNISSEAGSVANANGINNYGYSMSKAAMNMGARIMDNWLCGRKIRTISIHPGRMRTEMRGAHSDIDPCETAQALLKIADDLDSYDAASHGFMDYKGNAYPW